MSQEQEIAKMQLLVGHVLKGFMPVQPDNIKGIFDDGCDNVLALYVDDDCWLLGAPNQDYSRHDEWVLIKSKEYIPRTDAYKAIGEKIISVLDKRDSIKEWTDENDQYWLEFKTKTKLLRFGHHWNDCHYPNSIWEAS